MAWDKTRLLEDFGYFLEMLWDHLMLPKPTPVQYDIADFLQNGPKRCVIEAFRGIGKSWITAAFVLWNLKRDPQLKILVVSANKDRATAFSTFTKRLIAEVPFLTNLRIDPSNKAHKNHRDSVEMFDVGPTKAHQAPSVKSSGIFGQITGTRADIIIADDIEVPKNSYTQTMRERLSEAIKEFSAILLPGDDKRIIYLGTPQTEESIYNILPDRGFEVRIWPARYPKEDWVEAWHDRAAPWIINHLKEGKAQPGDPVDPGRFNEFDLTEREVDYGKSGFALQFMLDTRLTDELRYPLKHRDLVCMDVDKDMAPIKLKYGSDPKLAVQDIPLVGFTGDRYYRPFFVAEEWQDYQQSVLAIDPAGRGKDETGYAVVKMLYGQLYLTASGGIQGEGYSESALKKLATVAKEHRVNEIIVEENFGGGMWVRLFEPIMRKIYPCTITEVRHTGQKELRIIDTLEPVMNRHRLAVSPELVRNDAKVENLDYQLFYQMSRLTRDRGALAHDDRLESLSMAVSYYSEQMGKDTDEAYADHEEHLLNKELEKFMKHWGIESGKDNALSCITGRRNH